MNGERINLNVPRSMWVALVELAASRTRDEGRNVTVYDLIEDACEMYLAHAAEHGGTR